MYVLNLARCMCDSLTSVHSFVWFARTEEMFTSARVVLDRFTELVLGTPRPISML